MSRPGLTDTVGRWALAANLTLGGQRLLRPAIALGADPGAAQKALLRGILSQNADTGFGRHHGFAKIDGQETWQRAVPVHGYEELRPWIEKNIETGTPSLTAEPPVAYNITSGTTDKPKLIPITNSGLKRQKRNQKIFASALYAMDAKLFSGQIFGISSPAVEGHLDNGVPFGSASGVIYRQTPRLVRSRFVLAPAVSEISDYDAKYRVIATHMLADERVTLATAANPSSLLRLLSVIEAQLDEILSDVSAGTLSIDTGLPPGEDAILRAGLAPHPERAARLARLAEAKGRLDLSDIWPGLRGLATWTGGSCGVALDALRERMSGTTRVIEFGYLSSEFRGTVNVDPARNLCLPTLQDVYFEFVEETAWDLGDRDFKTLDQLEPGGRYSILATTPDGLYRYHINDIVEVTGFIGATPALAFVRKGQGVTNITGEKLTEAQMTGAVLKAADQAQTRVVFYKALADEERRTYDVYVETDGGEIAPIDFAEALDRMLAEANIEYREKRRSGRLQPPSIFVLRGGAEDACRRHAIAGGQREAQYKVLPLGYARDSQFDFAAWTADPVLS